MAKQQSSVSERERTNLCEPRRYKVYIYNDDFIPMEFVVRVLMTVFFKNEAEANRLAASLYICLHSDQEELKKVDIASLRKFTRPVRRAERREFRQGRRLDRRMRRAGYDGASVERFNRKADARFKRYKHRFAL